MKAQVVVIHGGDTFPDYESYLNFLKDFDMDLERYKSEKKDWKPTLGQKLGGEYEVFLPAMPNKTNAVYREWKLWFEKILEKLGQDIVLVGHSLGASFLIKYLSENKVDKNIKSVHLVSGVFDKDFDGLELCTFALPEALNLQTKNVFLYHSEDDPVVPFSALEKIASKVSGSTKRVFKDRKHMNMENFPELVEDVLSVK